MDSRQMLVTTRNGMLGAARRLLSTAKGMVLTIRSVVSEVPDTARWA